MLFARVFGFKSFIFIFAQCESMPPTKHAVLVAIDNHLTSSQMCVYILRHHRMLFSHVARLILACLSFDNEIDVAAKQVNTILRGKIHAFVRSNFDLPVAGDGDVMRYDAHGIHVSILPEVLTEFLHEPFYAHDLAQILASLRSANDADGMLVGNNQRAPRSSSSSVMFAALAAPTAALESQELVVTGDLQPIPKYAEYSRIECQHLLVQRDLHIDALRNVHANVRRGKMQL